ncbi:Gaa1-like GPI transamidase component [Coniophora puteana RWD-64-598 SS2]|uniref:Gaa1-like GPI transamidase component n=1 Tax=Coniophora puteana (strain RWD-64-598) TaxID=741705 RepID=A0A5M3N265_CONPW|nr:Gaa1-like GPI transamidase component [Coniophora puteana RWD-64-598 SS2]EIW85104.1 Gaa1-like GPI transamidase component [Coniophora puteana RWD-64-598 SS2]
MLLIPHPALSQRTYIDENALQPAQVNTYWNWGEVNKADVYLNHIEGLYASNASSHLRAEFIKDEFAKLGLSSSLQNYSYITSSGDVQGVNAYAVLSSPRTASTEAIVVSAAWSSGIQDGQTPNMRGVATVLALAGYLKGYSLWAKDLVFVVSDGYLDGMYAWLNAYHGTVPANLQSGPLEYPSGTIWTALNIDYPGHSFSHLGVFYEGLNGRLPNQDLINSLALISAYTGGVPVTVYDHIEPRENLELWDQTTIIPHWVPAALRHHPALVEYAYRARNIIRHVSFQARGRASGVHGLFHKFRIDAITLFAIPAIGPHGFHALGRILESTLRTANNLLERLHASFFFYILTTPGEFMKIGKFLPSPILIGIGLMLGGLGAWVNAGCLQTLAENGGITWLRRRRRVADTLVVMAAMHVMGAIAFITTSSRIGSTQPAISWAIFASVYTVPLTLKPYMSRGHGNKVAPFSLVLKSFNLYLSSAVISIVSLLNFSLAAMLAVFLGIPLITSSSSPNFTLSIMRYTGYSILACWWMLLCPSQVSSAVSNWDVLGVWFAPFMFLVYVPLVMQAAFVTLQIE